jgi:hypothetical protein
LVELSRPLTWSGDRFRRTSSTRRILDKDRHTGRPGSLRINPNGAFASGSGHPASAASCRGTTTRQGRDGSSEFNLFRDAERVLDLDSEIADRAFQLRVAEQKLNRSQVPRLLIDLRAFVRRIECVP